MGFDRLLRKEAGCVHNQTANSKDGNVRGAQLRLTAVAQVIIARALIDSSPETVFGDTNVGTLRPNWKGGLLGTSSTPLDDVA